MTILTLSRHRATILVGNIVCNKSITGVKRKGPVAITNLLFLEGESYECFSYPRNLHSLPFSTETLACSYLLIVWQDDV